MSNHYHSAPSESIGFRWVFSLLPLFQKLCDDSLSLALLSSDMGRRKGCGLIEWRHGRAGFTSCDVGGLDVQSSRPIWTILHVEVMNGVIHCQSRIYRVSVPARVLGGDDLQENLSWCDAAGSCRPVDSTPGIIASLNVWD